MTAWRSLSETVAELLAQRPRDLSPAFRVAAADLPAAKSPARWAATAGYGWSSRGTVWLAGVERRVVGPAWIGVEGGVVGGDALIAARVRVEW